MKHFKFHRKFKIKILYENIITKQARQEGLTGMAGTGGDTVFKGAQDPRHLIMLQWN